MNAIPFKTTLFTAVLTGILFLAVGVGKGRADAPSTYKIGSQTTITLDGEASTADQLKVGMRAFIQPDSFQEGFALSIDAQSGKTADEPKAKKAASKAEAQVITSISATSITIQFK